MSSTMSNTIWFADIDEQIITCADHRRDGMVEISADEAWEIAGLAEGVDPTPALACHLHVNFHPTLEQVTDDFAAEYNVTREIAAELVAAACVDLFITTHDEGDGPCVSYAESYAIQTLASNR